MQHAFRRNVWFYASQVVFFYLLTHVLVYSFSYILLKYRTAVAKYSNLILKIDFKLLSIFYSRSFFIQALWRKSVTSKPGFRLLNVSLLFARQWDQSSSLRGYVLTIFTFSPVYEDHIWLFDLNYHVSP